MLDAAQSHGHLQFANDPRGTRLRPNCEMTDAGYLRVTQTRVPAFDLTKSIEANAAAELRWDYGDGYWALFEALGGEGCPIEVL